MKWTLDFETIDSLSYEVLHDEEDSDLESERLRSAQEEAFFGGDEIRPTIKSRLPWYRKVTLKLSFLLSNEVLKTRGDEIYNNL